MITHPIFDSYLAQMQEIVDRDYAGKLWVYQRGYYPVSDHTIYYGDLFDIKELIAFENQHLKNPKIVPYNVALHGTAAPVDAVATFNEVFKPKSYGDLVSFEGEMWFVSGFNDDSFSAIDANWQKLRDSGVDYRRRRFSYEDAFETITCRGFDKRHRLSRLLNE
jgi:hypothetical protein